MKISVKSVHFSVDAKLVAFIEQKLVRLTKVFDKIGEAEVLLKLQRLRERYCSSFSSVRVVVLRNLGMEEVFA